MPANGGSEGDAMARGGSEGDEHGSGSECPICCDTIPDGDGTDVDRHALSCGHVFHRSCIQEWFQRKATCPLCRSNATDAVELPCGACQRVFSAIRYGDGLRGAFAARRQHRLAVYPHHDFDVDSESSDASDEEWSSMHRRNRYSYHSDSSDSA